MRLLKRFAIGFNFAAIICGSGLLTLYLTLPSHSEIKQVMQLENLDVSSQVFDRTGKWIGKFSIKNRYLISYKDLPDHLVFSFTSAEDKEFFSHFGINLTAIARAFYINLKRGRVVQGASTITQQLAKSFFLSNERTISRKLKEAMLAFKIEKIFPKEKILEIYLNKIFLGNHSYGVGAAAKAYFGKQIEQLNIGESALLAALPKAPSYFAPHKHYKRALIRQKKILGRMFANGHISQEGLDFWLKNPPKIATSMDYAGDYGYFLDMVKSEVFQKFSFDKNHVNGLNIHSSLDSNLQRELLLKIKSLDLNLRAYEHSSSSGLELAFISLNHETGEILAISGGGEYNQTQFNRALYTKRPIGQLVIPLTLIYPLELGYQLDSHLTADGSTILSVLASRKTENLNSVIELIGMGGINEFLFRLGLPISEHSFFKSLGVIRASPIQLVGAYASIFNGGKKISPFTIKVIESVSRKAIYQHKPFDGQAIMRKESAFLMGYSLKLLSSTKPSNRGQEKGIIAYHSVSQGLRNAWLTATKGPLTHILWLGGEYGKSQIASSRSHAIKLLNRISAKVLEVQGGEYKKVKKPKNRLSISFGRYSLNGQSLTIPIAHF